MMNRFFLFGLVTLFTIANLEAVVLSEDEKNHLSISSMDIKEIGEAEVLPLDDLTSSFQGGAGESINPGRIISVGKELVALGEDVYRLVNKGRPNITTSYAPISVLPKVNGRAVDVLELENFRAPVRRTYEITYKNLYQINVVVFRFSVIFSHGGSYDGRGAYITGAQIVPDSVRVLFGFDFDAKMRLGGLQNNGTKANPNAAATLQIEYSVNSVMTAITKVESFFITGRGGFRKL